MGGWRSGIAPCGTGRLFGNALLGFGLGWGLEFWFEIPLLTVRNTAT